MHRIEELCGALGTAGIDFVKDAPLSERSSFKIGGRAALIIEPDDEAELAESVALVRRYGLEFFLLGNGSNLVFSDEGYHGVIIATQGLRTLNIKERQIEAGCGVSMIQLALAAMRAGLSGAEFLYGIPGSLGGGVYMNAGAYGSQLSDVLKSVRYLDTMSGRVIESRVDELGFSYRYSAFMEHREYVILSAAIELSFGNPADIEAKMKGYMNSRREKQPLEYPSAGSAFKRKQGYFMGKIIEESGLKGYSVGGAMISEKHAGFIINTGNATAADVAAVVAHVKETILKNYGFEPECEIIFVGTGDKS